MTKVKYSHANLIATDWKKIAKFYVDVFGCVPVGPVRRLSGQSVADGTGLIKPEIEGIHLRLPGNGEGGPTLEVFQYCHFHDEPEKFANSRGFSHIAFEVSDVEAVCAKVISSGGWLLGKLARQPVEGVGICTFIYVRDPDRNIIELQAWEAP
ncbi:VOC family protein [Pseudomonas putida]|jgi:catechol 2,3-dioxygenase-like lactoylglutathione lyase family enzyme|uniref:VOC family protein n=1 Tax=Pseudomonas putida TaxID=303 RepID=A0A7Y8D0X5_PSEPU|nr:MULTISPECIES: VOC family protein [Pseudomonas]KAF1312711.1 glyoxalase [Pseudomonas sp. SG-MS2]NWC80630.1 VOC family protein [Pseudomonas putida]RRV43852.1 glyoxalase/bleomycin resistance/dioxygenase family protein [Pseudomonas sp. p106]